MVSKFPVSLISIYTTLIFEIVVNYFVFKEYLNFLPLIFRHIFVDFVEKEPSAKFSGLLISFHEVIKSHGFECGVMHSKWTERFTPDFIFYLVGKNLNNFMIFLTIHHEFLKIQVQNDWALSGRNKQYK